MRLVTLFILFGFCGYLQAAWIQPASLDVQEGHGFIVWLYSEENITDCQLRFGQEDGSVHGLVETLDQGNASECGFRVRNVKSSGNGKWTFNYDYQGPQDAHFTVTVKDNDPDGRMADEQNVEEVEKSVDEPAALMDPASRFDDVVENEISVVLSCNPTQKESSCQAEHVGSGRIFSLHGTLMTSDAKFWSNVVHGSKQCVFELLKPIDPHYFGVWKMNYKGNECRFNVKPNDKDPSIVLRTMGNNATIECARNLTYPLKRCFIKNLTGDKVEFQTKQQLQSRKCEFTKPATESPTEWLCGYNGPLEKDPDVIVKFTVQKERTRLVDASVEILDDKNFDNIKTVIATVSEINKTSLEHCLVVGPSGRIFHLRANQAEIKEEEADQGVVSPYGSGLEAGNCGMQLNDVVDPVGNWYFMVVTQDGEKLTTTYEMQNFESKETSLWKSEGSN